MNGPEAGLRQILANGMALFLAYVLPRVFTIGSVVVAARWLGTEDFGAYGTAAAFAVIAAVFATLGMQPLLVREIARAPERAGTLVRAAHVVKTGSGTVMLGGAALLSGVLFPDAPEVRAAALVLCVGWALNAYAENLAAYFQAVERMGRWTQASAIFGLVSASVGVGLLFATGSLVAYCWGFVAGWAAALVWLWMGVPAEVRGERGAVGGEVRHLMGGLAPFAAAFVGLTVYSKVDVILLARWSGAAEVGVYSAAYKFVDVFQALVIVAAGAVFPRLARTADRRSGGGWGGARSTEVLVLGAVPVGLTLHLVAGPAVGLIFGPAYAGSAPVLAMLALLLPLLGLSIHGGYVLGAAGRMLPVAILYGVGVGVNLAFNQALIPSLGAQGAALSRLASETLMVVGFLVVLRAVGDAAPGARAGVTILGVIGAALVTLAAPDPTGGLLRGAAMVVATAVLYAATGVISRADVARVRAALRRGSGAQAAGQGVS